MVFNPLLRESLKRIEEFGSSQPRGSGQRNLGMDFLTDNAITSLLPTTQETNENVASLIGERRLYGRGQGTPLNLGILDMGRGVDRRFRPRADVAPVVADSSAQSDVALLPLVGASQTDSTPTNMQASNMSLIAENLNEKEIEEEIELKKQTKFGDAMARIGGGITLNEEQRKALSPTAREKYNQERLSARNKGIAEMLFVLSDALAGRDVAGRAMARAQARLPKEKSAREKINEELLRVYRALEEVGGEPEKLPAYEKAIYDARIANQTGYGFPGTIITTPSDNDENEEEDEADLIAKKYLQSS